MLRLLFFYTTDLKGLLEGERGLHSNYVRITYTDIVTLYITRMSFC